MAEEYDRVWTAREIASALTQWGTVRDLSDCSRTLTSNRSSARIDCGPRPTLSSTISDGAYAGRLYEWTTRKAPCLSSTA